jgi:predicted nucleic acid-binding protein
MPPKYNVVIADTSCFILLDKIDELTLLQKLFGSITTTFEIANEFGKQLPEWVFVKAISDIHYQALLELDIDKGEASAITLAVESEPALLIIDDLKARKLAEKLNLNYTGTLGVFLKAKEQGLLLKIRPILDKIQLTNFRLSNKVFNEILLIAGE